MRTLLTLILVFTFSLFGLAQHSGLTNIQMLSSSPMTSLCDSTIGTIYQSATPIPTYGYLESNGYCYFLPQPQISFTLCFHFIAISSDVYLNSGFGVLGLCTTTFNSLMLCDRTDNIMVGQGQFFTNLIIGHEYVWCVVGTTSGLYCQGLSKICPYWNESSLLPVDLTLFTSTPTNNGILLHWTTMSESNSDYFILERSKDLYTFAEVTRIRTSTYSNNRIDYEYLDRVPYDGVSYYRLIQVDLNGDRKIYDPIFANITFKKPVRIMDILGNTVDMNHNGIKILIFDDGSVIKYH